MRSILASRSYLAPVLLVLLAVAACGLYPPRTLDDLGAFVFDSWQRLKPRVYDPSGAVRIVVVGEKSLARFGQWPWPRTRLAEATRRLGALGASAVAFDIVFAETDRTSLEAIVTALPDSATRKLLQAELPGVRTNDQLFVDALGQANTVLGTTLLAKGAPVDLEPKAAFVFAGDEPHAFVARFPSAAAPLPLFREAAKGIGATNWLPDRDQVIRRVPLIVRLGDQLMPSLSAEALRVAQGASTIIVRSSNASGQSAFGSASGVNAVKIGDVAIATGANADIRPYYTPTNPARFIPIEQLLDGSVDKSEIEGRIVLVGTTAIGLGDVRATPLDAAVPGVEIQAQILESILADTILSRPDWAPGAEFAAALLLGLLVALTLPFMPPWLGGGLVAASVAAAGLASFLAFDRAHALIDPSLPSLSMIGVYLVGTLALWRTERIAREQVRMAFGKFLAPAVVDRLAADPRGLILGGETRRMTVLFSDIRDFASLSEGLEAHELTQFMNAYLTPMTDAILDHDGTVDKYIGDAIVAFWNAPLDVPHHEERAVEAALRMRAELAALNATRAQPVSMGIGLNVGPCTVGNLGSLRRFDYSVLGDAANLGARLEGASKLYGVDIVVSQAIVDAAPGFAWLELDLVCVKGRSEATRIFTLAGDETFAGSAAYSEWRERHAALLEAYRAGDFDRAAGLADELGSSAPKEWATMYAAFAKWLRFVAVTPQRASLFPVRMLDSK